jgi:hypothetical protein
MRGPQIIAELSTPLLTRMVHNLIGTSIGCPDDPKQRFSDIDITEVIAFRGNDGFLGGIVEGVAADLRKNLDPDISVDLTVLEPGGGGLIEVPVTFLLVSGTARIFSDTQLGIQGMSDPPGDPFRFVFSRFTPSDSTASAPLLFQLTIEKDASAQNLVARLQFISAFNAAALAVGGSRIVDAVRFLRKRQLPPVLLPSLTGVFSALGSSMVIVNQGATTEDWIGDLQGTGTRGIRIGFDILHSDDYSGWIAFYAGTPWDLQSSGYQEEWAVFASGDFLMLMSQQAAGSLLKPQGDISFSLGRNLILTADWDGSRVSISSPVYSRGVEVGTVSLTMKPSVGAVAGFQGESITTFQLTLCANFNLNPGVAIGVTLLGSLVGTAVGGIGGPWGALIGGLFGTALGVAGDLIITDYAKSQAANRLKAPNAQWKCGPLQDGCRDCGSVINRFIANIGQLRLRRVTNSQSGVVLAGSVDWSPAGSLPRIARLELSVGTWQPAIAGICGTPSRNPVQSLRLKNSGDLPLVICGIDDLSGIDVLKVVRGTEPVSFPFNIDAGTVYDVTILAAIDEHPEYNPAQQLNIRVLSNGGASIVDLNAHGSAKLEDEQEWLRRVALYEALCSAIGEHMSPQIWRGIEFIDPVPFERRDRLVESLQIQLSAVENPTVEVVGTGGRILARTTNRLGPLRLSTDVHRVPAIRHASCSFFVRKASDGETSQKALSFDQKNLPSRLLYREGPWVTLGAPIRGALAFSSEQLAVLMESALCVTGVTWRRLGPWHTVLLDRPRGMARLDGGLAVITAEQLLYYDRTLRCRARLEGAFIAVAATGEKLWVADERRMIEFHATDSTLTENRSLDFSGIDQLLSDGRRVFAIKQHGVWDVTTSEPRDLGIAAHRLAAFGGTITAVYGDRAVTFDSSGQPIVEYAYLPWFASIIEWPSVGVAIETRESGALLVLYERHQTLLDLRHQPEPVQTWLQARGSRHGQAGHGMRSPRGSGH